MITKPKEMINDVIKALMQQASSSASGSRSNAIKPLLWLVGLFLPALIISSIYSQSWITFFLAAILIAFCIFFIWVYSFCLLKNPDLLRSEKFQLEKMVVEQTFLSQTKYGDAIKEDGVARVSPENYQLINGIQVEGDLIDEKDED